MRRVRATIFLLALLLASPAAWAIRAPETDWRGEWIGVIGGSKPNTWLCYRKAFSLDEAPQSAVARIACDSKYWLWINGELIVFEGQLKRGPTPHDTYFDRVDLTPHLRAGENTIAVLVWHFGRHGFSHNSSGKAALLFDAQIDGRPLVSDETWLARVHPAFGTTDPPLDNVRQPESNVRFDARHDLGAWMLPEYDASDWGPPTLFGKAPVAPWNQLYERPIPQWRWTEVKEYESVDQRVGKDGVTIHLGRLPYNAQVTPYLKVEALAGKAIRIDTDLYDLYGNTPGVGTHWHQYVTRDGVQEFELPAWINGHTVQYHVPAGVRVLELKYRESGYDTQVVGSFRCSDRQLNQLWEEAVRTLYVTMRDTYMDCPDRERAQWWGDAVNELGEAFYVFETERAPRLTKKAIYELARWQRPDGSLYSPVPSGVRRDGLLYPLDGSWDQELPRQMLASIGWYGFWTYYQYSGDRQTIADVYPAVRRYLDLWVIGDDGLVVHRAGGWDWTDWGEHRDVPVIENAWVHLALRGAIQMARLAGADGDIPGYQSKLRSIEAHFNQAYWRGDRYRSEGHSGETDDRANAMAVVAGLAGPERYDAIAKVLTAEQHASPYMEKYVLEALLRMRRPDLAIDRMRKRYAAMLSDDKTTLWEFFDPITLDGVGDMGRGTYNHAWSGGPLTILSQHFAGVAPTEPAYQAYEITPQLGRLAWIDATTPTPHGPIGVRLRRLPSDGLRYEIDAPAGAEGSLVIQSDQLGEDATVLVAGETVFANENAVKADTHHTVTLLPTGDLRVRLPEGRSVIELARLSGANDPNALTAAEELAGYVSLFDGDSLAGWSNPGNWIVEGNAIHRAADGGFLSHEGPPLPDDFELRFQWKVAHGANSGVYYRPGQYEYQILDNRGHSDGDNPRTSAASLYFCVAPSHDNTRPVGEWNQGRVICQGSVIQHWLNGECVVAMDYSALEWAEDIQRLAELKGDLTTRGGRLHLQDHGDPVWFRGIKLRELPDDEALEPCSPQPAPIPAEAIEKENAILQFRREARLNPQ